jgi:hypothetical protein
MGADLEKIMAMYLEEEKKVQAEKKKGAEREQRAKIKYYEFH